MLFHEEDDGVAVPDRQWLLVKRYTLAGAARAYLKAEVEGAVVVHICVPHRKAQNLVNKMQIKLQ